MKRIFKITTLLVFALLALSCSDKKYETVKGDPMGTKIYTLDNGLKVYMSVNKDQPRLTAYIAVRSGSKDDPSDNTGLAHYLEHLMFKGTESFGTSDYEAEKPLLDEIERLFEVYKQTTDPDQRKAVYHQIDSISYAASQIAIPNEYDKLMAAIGSNGTNAFTSEDITCYTEDIPSNQIENWAKVQADRFKNMVIRGFHTELETVYEEYNMYLNEDSENALIALNSALFHKHPYGLQTTIGTSDHLKNPSITAIKKQKNTFYVPNNVAICVAGDFDPDEFVDVIEKYFGDWQPNENLPERSYEEEDAINEPVEMDVYGTDADFLFMGWRYPGDKHIESEIAEVVGYVLQNGQAGLFDLDITQQQKLLAAQAMPYGRVDYGEMILVGYPKDGQTLDDARAILLAEVEKLRNGDFDDDLVEAVVANMKLDEMNAIERNASRVAKFYNAFLNGHNWADEVKHLDRLAKLTKQDIVDWANKYLSDNSYAVVYKHNGINPKNEKIEAPKITPIATNRDMASSFLTEVQNSVVNPIEPVFVDFEKDMSVFGLKDGIELLYKKNETNDIATLTFRFDKGLLDDPALSMAFNYLSYLGTSSRSAEEIAAQEYKLACSHYTSVGATTSSYSVSGLSENLPAALEIVEDLIANAQPDESILESLKQDELKARSVEMLNQSSCNSALRTYLMYGPGYVKKSTLSNEDVLAVTSDDLLSKVKAFMGYAHSAIYYGPLNESEIKTLLSENHKVSEPLAKLQKQEQISVLTPESKVIVAPYDSRQFNYTQFTCSGEKFSLEDAPYIALYNEYFGGGMNTIVFQEMREARALAYSARAMLTSPTDLSDSYSFYAFIGSQNDKLQQAVEAFDMIINDMPQSDKAFDIAKTALDARLRTQRTTGSRVISSYLQSKDLGLSQPLNQYVYEHLADIDMDDLVACQQRRVKDRTYIYGILGDINGMDAKYLRTLGPVEQVSLEEVFGY